MSTASSSPAALYAERNRRLLDRVALKETDRTPFVFDGAASIPDEAKPENVLAMARSVTKYAR